MFATRSARKLICNSSIKLTDQKTHNKQLIACVLHSRQYSSLIDNAFGWFKSNNKGKKLKATENTTSRELIEDIERGTLSTEAKKSDAVLNTNEKEENEGEAIKLNMREIEFIGKTGSKEHQNLQRRKALLSKVKFNQWWSLEKVQNEESFNNILLSINKELGLELNKPFADLNTKFAFAKQLQQQTGYMLSDYDVTRFSTPALFKDHFKKKIFSGDLAKFNEHLPNAIYLDVKSEGGVINNAGNNVYLVPNVPSHEQKKTFNRINNEANFLRKNQGASASQ
ncbi:hypothetical protein ACO0QE_002043 [Hanseniaspora vineae]